MILSLAAVGLAPGLGSTGQSPRAEVDEEGSPLPVETPVGALSFDAPERTIDASKSYNAVITTDAGEIVIALDKDAPEAANSFAFLAGQNFYDGLEFFWVLPGFDAQTGDPTCAASGDATCTGAGGPGYTLPKEGDAAKEGQWSVIAPALSRGSDRVHGSQFVVALTDEQFEGTLFGTVVEGQEILESLQKRAPCFGAEPSEANPCQPEQQLPKALVIKDVVVEPA
jgi:cyclophilin family peptidyl-prolyl cis-trans isomerase